MRRSRVTTAVVASILLVAAVPASAQTRSWLVGFLHESPGFFVPIAVLNSTNDDGRDWRLGIIGWTLEAELLRRDTDRRRRVFSVAVTPFNADNSNYVYRRGRVDDEASYKAASVLAAAGFEIDHGEHWTGAYRLLGSYRSVRELDAVLEEAWLYPFVGVEVSQTYRRVTATEFFGTRTDGVELESIWRGFFGDRSWSQFEVQGTAGHRTGRLFMTTQAAGFVGHGLNEVSAFLLGGSWGVADPRMVSGYRFGEFRLTRALTLSGRVDVQLTDRWEVGLRGSVLTSPAGRETGVGVEVRTLLSGVPVSVGVAFPGRADEPGLENWPVLYAGLSLAILQR